MKLKKSKRERDLSLDGKTKKKTKSKKHSDSASLNKTADPGSLSDDDTELSKLVNQKNAHVIDADLFKRTYFGPDEQTLELDCWEEGLSEVQLAAYKQAEAEHQSVQCKLDEIVKETGGEVVYTGDQFMAYQLIGKAPGLSDLEAKSAQILRSQSREPEPLLKRKGRKEKPSYRDFTPPPPPSPPSPPRTRDKKLTRGKKGKVPEKEKEKEKEKEREKDKKEKKEKSIPATPTNVQSVTSGVRPSEASAIGGLATGAGAKSTPVVDLTKEDTKHVADSREVSFNKLQGKTFPSLVVVARPYLHAKDSTAPTDRAALDSKVKSVLMHTPTKFTEWLIQHGLVKSEQVCAVHPGNKLKLGMYSDVSKFPYSGGYVWISECCPTRFVSVFSGSLFEGATHPPSVLLKLIYHWACQTNVQNVVQWVKVDNLYVKGLFTWLRAACTAALHHHICLLGGPGKKIEVGVISLGTTSHDGTQRQVKVEVLGILDTDAKLIRLRAVEPLSDGERNYKKRFQKILEPLTQWVNPASIIVTDLTVDKGTLVSMGFKTVHQSSSNDPSVKHSNANIMEYLRRIVPRMFQNTLSLLSRQIIQQFLDELVWREWYGTTPGQAFDNVVTHLAEQTRIDGKDTLSIRLNKISANPFKNWRYVNKTKPVEPELPVKETKRGRKRKASPTPPPASPPPRRNKAGKETRRKKPVNYVEDDDEDVVPLQIMPESKRDKKKKEKKEPKKKKDKWDEDIPLKMIKKEMKQEETVVLERYYFGQVEGDVDSKICKRNILVQCLQCSKEFNNNCQFMIHIYQHIAGVPLSTDSRMVAQCIYCLQHFADVEALEAHLHQSHPKDTKSPGIYTFACLICEIRFTTMQALASHMQKTHAPLELPYNCGVCEYRSSSHRACIDHFHSIHGGGESIQCPYCLKVVAIYANGCDLQSNIESFMKHLMLHQDKQLSHKCNRCILKFVHTGMMREHQVRAHHSVKGAKPLCVEEHIIGKPKNKATPPVKDSTHHSILDSFDNVTLVLPQGMLCKECDTQLDEKQHFLGTCKCNKCTFVTCCWRAMLQHSSVCMGPNAQQTLNTTLPSTAHCICSFETDDAGALLNHLLLCERRTAYSSEEDAKSNKINISKGATTAIESPETKKDSILEDTNAELSQTDLPSQQTESMADYPAPPSVINTQLSLDDLAPPSVLQPDQMDLEPLKNEAYEQPLATPQVRHHDLDADPQQEDQTPTQASRHLSQANQSLDSYMDSTGEFEPLPAEPLPQPEFEPL